MDFFFAWFLVIMIWGKGQTAHLELVNLKHIPNSTFSKQGIIKLTVSLLLKKKS